MSVRSFVRFLRRRWTASYGIDDPRPIADSAPYTFHLPSEAELLALRPGDVVKIIIRSVPAGTQWDAERIWVTLTKSEGDRLSGQLANEPFDMPQLKPGSVLRFRRSDVIDIEWPEARQPSPPPSPPRRWYWDRCLVDQCVLDEGALVHFLYREEPETPEGETFADSGWRIRGDYRGATDEAVENRQVEYVALGKVLNVDDSWLPLIDTAVGSRWLRDWSTDRFEPER